MDSNTRAKLQEEHDMHIRQLEKDYEIKLSEMGLRLKKELENAETERFEILKSHQATLNTLRHERDERQSSHQQALSDLKHKIMKQKDEHQFEIDKLSEKHRHELMSHIEQYESCTRK